MGNEAPKPGEQATPPANPPPVDGTKPPEAPPANTVVPPEKPADAVPPVVPPVDGVKPPEQKPPDKPNEKPNEAAGAPDKYDLKVPENSLLSQAHVDSLMAYAKEKGMDNAAAQALLEREHNAAKASIDSIQQRAEKYSQDCLAVSKADKEIGGDKFAENVELANHALNKLGFPVEFRKMLDASGLGNEVNTLKAFIQVGKMLKPGSIVQPSGNPPLKKDPVKTMYDHPTSQPKS